MHLKRLHNDGKVVGVSVAHTGTHPEQNFPTQTVAEGLEEGWIVLLDDKLVVLAAEGDLIYTVLRRPGRYCCHCQERLPDDDKGSLARLHVAEKHRGVVSPDPVNAAGYRKLNAFECVLNAEAHAKFKAKPGAPLTFTRIRDELKAGKELSHG